MALSPEISIAALFSRIAEKWSDKIAEFLIDRGRSVVEALSLNFSDYFENMIPKCSNVKTLISRDEPIPLSTLYVKTYLYHKDKIIDDQKFIDSLTRPKPVIIAGSAGSGKSIFMKYLFIHLIENIDFRIPLFVELRNLNSLQNWDLISLVYNSIIRPGGTITPDQFRAGLKNGLFILLLDGFDEVDYDNRPELEKEILELQESNPRTQIIISSRMDDRFGSWSQFYLYRVQPMEKDEIIKLLGKIPYDREVRAKFAETVKSELYDKHTSFLSNPLLATMMLVTFDQFAYIPDKIHIFYEQAFEALFFRHDTSKQAAFQRKRYTKLAIDQFKNCLSTFCIASYVKHNYQFSEAEIYDYIRKVLEFERLEE